MRKVHPITSGVRKGFTLVEVVISMGIMALLAASVYAIVSSAIGASRTAMEQQLTLRRLDAFLRVTREAFLNLPAAGSITLEIARARGGEAESRLVLGKPQGLFGLPSLGGGSLVLAARAQSDGTRTMTLLRIPANAYGQARELALSAPGIPLLPKLLKPRWFFQTPGQNETWREELPANSPRPILVRLQMEVADLPEPVESIFFVPPVSASATNASTTSSEATASPTPSSSPTR